MCIQLSHLWYPKSICIIHILINNSHYVLNLFVKNFLYYCIWYLILFPILFAEKKVCDPQCKNGCWGEGPHRCLDCRNYIVENKNLCVASCESLPLLYNASSKVCKKCHDQCADKCTGPVSISVCFFFVRRTFNLFGVVYLATNLFDSWNAHLTIKLKKKKKQTNKRNEFIIVSRVYYSIKYSISILRVMGVHHINLLIREFFIHWYF